MADDLELTLSSIEGEGPSSDFVASLRERIVTEMADSAVAASDGPVVAVDLRPEEGEDSMTKKSWMWAGAAAATIVVIGGIVALNGDADDGQVVITSTPEDSTAAVVATTVTSTTTTTTTTVPEPVVFPAAATPLTLEASPLEAGTYRVDTVGTPFAFTSEEPLFVQINNEAFFVVTDPGSQREDDKDIVFMRLTALWDPTGRDTSLEDLGDEWSPGDFAGWLDNLSDGVVASDREETTLGGLDATRSDLEVSLDACIDFPDFCVGFGTNGLVNSKILRPGSQYRIWVVEQDDQDPLAVIVGIASESDSDWFDTAEEVLSTLAFGEVAPNPMVRSSAGPSDQPLLGGIQIELTEDATVLLDSDDFGKILLEGQPAAAEFLTNPLDFDGNTLETADDVVAVLDERNIEVTEIEPTTIGGVDARVFEMSGNSTRGVLKRYPDDDRGWRPPPQGQIWLIEHPDRGLLMITAEAGDEVDIVFPLILAQTEQILESLEFIELG